jgi:outer membrane protein OmpA-like peptidoglycan-associated protein
MKKIYRTLLLLVLFISSNLSAQDFPGYNTSNYAGISSIDIQPASIVDSRYIVDANIIGFNVSFGNNYVGIKKEAFKDFNNFSDPDFQKKFMVERPSSQNKSVYLTNQIVLPSFMVNLNKKSAIAFSWRVRTYFNVDGIEPELAKLAYEGVDWPDLWNLQISNKALSIQTMSWAEYGITYGRVLMDEGQNFFKAAVHVKLLQGLQAMYFYVDNLKYNFKNDDTLSLFNSDIAYGHSTNFEFSPGRVKYKFVSNPGVGFDLGVVYEWRPDYQKFKYNLDGDTGLYRRDKNKYKLKIGFSATDIGSIKFQKGQYSNNFNANISLWNVHDLHFDGVTSFDDTIQRRFTVNPEEKDFSMNLPTAFSLQFDYHVWKDFYLNFTPFYALKHKNNKDKVHDISNYSLTPRWDHKWFGIYVPVAYNGFGLMTLGTSVRIGPLIVGTGNLIPLVANKDFYGSDFHFMLKVPIMHRKVRDRDKDGVSDKKDKCIDVPGIWEFLGCPDRDRDHVEDAVDVCPDEPGLPGLNGCPDKDGDGITDKQDACPDEKGIMEFNGCPDKDGDKIIDKDDDCPDEAGLPEFKGCPDRDKDGVMDKDDRCPERQGTINNKGCPEIRLHLIDAQGNVLKTAVMTEDKVFVYSSLPMGESAVFKLEGEDTELMKDLTLLVDGQAKKVHRSPDFLFRFEYGKGSDNGMKKMEAEDVPIVLDQKEAEVLKKAFDNLEFATGKDIIKATSFTSLNELAELMKKKKEWKIKISGHTDNQGNPATNMKLSQKRAEAVKKYLVSKGISAKRIKTEWFGQTKPVGDNKTEEGRQKNRRVEMLIVE